MEVFNKLTNSVYVNKSVFSTSCTYTYLLMALVCSTQSMSMFISISMLKNSPFPSSVQSLLKGAAGAAPFIGCEAGVARECV